MGWWKVFRIVGVVRVMIIIFVYCMFKRCFVLVSLRSWCYRVCGD